jgi:hypothetical protein
MRTRRGGECVHVHVIGEVLVGAVEHVGVAAGEDPAGIRPAVVVRPVEVAVEENVEPDPPAVRVVVQDDLVEDVVVLAQRGQAPIIDYRVGQFAE